jgi:hypothetical protein
MQKSYIVEAAIYIIVQKFLPETSREDFGRCLEGRDVGQRGLYPTRSSHDDW